MVLISAAQERSRQNRPQNNRRNCPNSQNEVNRYEGLGEFIDSLPTVEFF